MSTPFCYFVFLCVYCIVFGTFIKLKSSPVYHKSNNNTDCVVCPHGEIRTTLLQLCNHQKSVFQSQAPGLALDANELVCMLVNES